MCLLALAFKHFRLSIWLLFLISIALYFPTHRLKRKRKLNVEPTLDRLSVNCWQGLRRSSIDPGSPFVFSFVKSFVEIFKKSQNFYQHKRVKVSRLSGSFCLKFNPLLILLSKTQVIVADNLIYFIHRLFQLFQVKVGLGELLKCLVCDLKSQ